MDNISTIILAGSLIVIMLGMGLTLRGSDFKRIFRYPKAIFIGLSNQLLLLPIIGFGVTLFFPMQPEIAIGVMILAACPGGPTSNLISHLAKADLALSVTLTAFSSLITILTIPFIVNFALEYYLGVGQVVELNVLSTIIQIFVIVVIPIATGMLVRKYRPHFADKMAKPVRIASGAVLGLIIVGLVIKERTNFVSYFEQAGVAALVLNVITMVLGYFSAKLFGLSKEAARSISIESGIQNGTLAITIAVVLLHNASFAIVPAVYSLLMFLTGGVIIYLFNRKAT
ncbi:bile acid:sodium symporter family protein [Aequorivita marisscotiae]|uniref:Bile acid:sodium symporter family protein n=1 Tax=Aequorivita marisscotiae TaxID=3040348 RepID=A0ABY8KVF6_9FLAO|nr:bile acid:sodium symporter family protein [Aequorivita sp. Ant34-E75]WGF91837.1 bile acid:sodium symporter family protein [Aequorivita sp. Ant34-E75]